MLEHDAQIKPNRPPYYVDSLIIGKKAYGKVKPHRLERLGEAELIRLRHLVD